MRHPLPVGGLAAAAAFAIAVATAPAGVAADTAEPAGQPAGEPDFTLTILHNNDGESQLVPFTLPDGTEYGGVALFGDVVKREQTRAVRGATPAGQADRRGVVLLNAGDSYLAGQEFAASSSTGFDPFYDAVAVRDLDYDALAIGNHEFDFGPDVLGEFVEQTRGGDFVSANLDVSAEPALADTGRIRPYDIVRESGERIGVVGLTTPTLRQISSPRDVVIDPDVVAVAQAQVDELTAQGVDKIVVLSHLQGIQEEIDLVGQLRGVDAVVGGGGDELLADSDDPLIPGDTRDGDYPLVATDLDGTAVPVVTTAGDYRYLGRLVLTFDAGGEVISWSEDSGTVRVIGEGPDGEYPDAENKDVFLRNKVERPVAAFTADLAETVVASTEVDLQCERADVRGGESNCGNLIADAHLASARALAPSFGIPEVDVAVMNGGGIRGEIDRPAGDLTLADTFDLQPFGNFVAVAPEVSAEDFRQLLEEGAVGFPDRLDGGFVQAAGFSYVADPAFPARTVDVDGNQLTPGERVRDVVLDDGTVVVEDGVTVLDGTLSVAGLNFSLGGGDAYPPQEFLTLGLSDQQSLTDYLTGPLGGVVTEADYPVAGEGRVTIR